MFCTKCGAKNEDGAEFCIQCGNKLTAAEPEPEELVEESVEEVVAPRRRESTKRRGAYAKPKRSGKLSVILAVVSVLLAVILVLQNVGVIGLVGGASAGSNGSAASGESVGYDTPGEVALAFVQAVKNKDMDSALSLFGCDLRAENTNVEEQLEYTEFWGASTAGFPAENQLYADGNLIKLKADAASQIEYLVASLGATDEEHEKYLSGGYVYDSDDASFAENTYSELSKLCSFDKAETLAVKAVLGIGFVGYDTLDINILKNAKSRASRYGAQEWTEVEILYEYDGEKYIGGMMLLKYDGKWYICDLYGVYLGATFGNVERWESWKEDNEDYSSVIEQTLSGSVEIDGENFTIDDVKEYAKEYIKEDILEMANAYGCGSDVLNDPEKLVQLFLETGDLSYEDEDESLVLDEISESGMDVFTDYVESVIYVEVY